MDVFVLNVSVCACMLTRIFAWYACVCLCVSASVYEFVTHSLCDHTMKVIKRENKKIINGGQIFFSAGLLKISKRLSTDSAIKFSTAAVANKQFFLATAGHCGVKRWLGVYNDIYNMMAMYTAVVV